MPEEPAALGQRRGVKPESLASKFAAPERSDLLRGIIPRVASDTPTAMLTEVLVPPSQPAVDPGRVDPGRTNLTAVGGGLRARPRQSGTSGTDSQNRRPDAITKSTGGRKKIEIKVPTELKKDLEQAAKRMTTTVSALVFQALEELHGDLPALVMADTAARSTASTSSPGNLFAPRGAAREYRAAKTAIALRANLDEIATMDELARHSGASGRSSMITLIATEWLSRYSAG